MKEVIRKHSAICLQFTFCDGEIKNYIAIGGRLYYAGRSGFKCLAAAPKDGFWQDSISSTIRNSQPMRLKDVVSVNTRSNEGKKPKCRTFMRHWESKKYEVR